MTKKKPGWYGESQRHALAAKGVKTGTKSQRKDAQRTVNPNREKDRMEKAKKDAYELGYEGGLSAFVEGTFSEEEAEEAIDNYMDNLHQTDYYANDVLPRLRELAGFEDTMGVGTYTDGDDEEHWTLEELHDEYDEGMLQGMWDAYHQAHKDAYRRGDPVNTTYVGDAEHSRRMSDYEDWRRENRG